MGLLYNPCGVERSGVEHSGAEQSGVERTRVERRVDMPSLAMPKGVRSTDLPTSENRVLEDLPQINYVFRKILEFLVKIFL